jgi:RDD family
MRKVGDGTRALNFFIDTLLIFFIAMLLFRWWNWYVVYWRFQAFNFGWFFFGTTFFYSALFESIFLRTPAKWFTHSKVVNKEGKRPSVPIIVWRSLLRLTLVDLFFGPFLGGPLHDYASGTTVVESDE